MYCRLYKLYTTNYHVVGTMALSELLRCRNFYIVGTIGVGTITVGTIGVGTITVETISFGTMAWKG